MKNKEDLFPIEVRKIFVDSLFTKKTYCEAVYTDTFSGRVRKQKIKRFYRNFLIDTLKKRRKNRNFMGSFTRNMYISLKLYARACKNVEKMEFDNNTWRV